MTSLFYGFKGQLLTWSTNLVHGVYKNLNSIKLPFK